MVLIGSCSGRLYAFSLATGEIRWDYDTNVEDNYTANFHGQPLVRGETIVVGTDGMETGYLYALNRETGEARWKIEEPAGIENVRQRLIAFAAREARLDVSSANGLFRVTLRVPAREAEGEPASGV